MEFYQRGTDMQMQETTVRYKLKNLVYVTVILLILSAVASALYAQTEEPWNALRDFTFVHGAIGPLTDGHVGAVLHNSAKAHFALVIFAGVCHGHSCAVETPLAYFVVDTQGLLLISHVEPGAKLESIGGFQIS
jgi:hypothetical protein